MGEVEGLADAAEGLEDGLADNEAVASIDGCIDGCTDGLEDIAVGNAEGLCEVDVGWLVSEEGFADGRWEPIDG